MGKLIRLEDALVILTSAMGQSHQSWTDWITSNAFKVIQNVDRPAAPPIPLNVPESKMAIEEMNRIIDETNFTYAAIGYRPETDWKEETLPIVGWANSIKVIEQRNQMRRLALSQSRRPRWITEHHKARK